jgi:hypothetical protein
MPSILCCEPRAFGAGIIDACWGCYCHVNPFWERKLRIPAHPAMHSKSIPATRTDLDPATSSTLKAARVTAF